MAGPSESAEAAQQWLGFIALPRQAKRGVGVFNRLVMEFGQARQNGNSWENP
jgi:hypothetical protein